MFRLLQWHRLSATAVVHVEEVGRLQRQGLYLGVLYEEVMKPVRTPVAILGSLGVCIYVPASRHWLISYFPVHLN